MQIADRDEPIELIIVDDGSGTFQDVSQSNDATVLYVVDP
jgi:hypothetical protein